MAQSRQSSSDRETLYLIDGHAQFFRAYHAIRAPMSSPVTGEPTQMTFSFMGMLLKLLRDYRPDYLAVVIDVAGDRETFRSALYPEYKANREAPPDDFHPQVERCLKLLEQFSIPVYGMEGVEADDVIGTIVERMQAQRPELAIEIVSRDKDLTQLLRDGVTMLDPMKDEHVTPSAIFKTEGVEPSQVIDMLALMGDTSDNVPGVPGIGPKTAAKLIMEYGSIDGLLEHLGDIKGKRRENLEASKDALPLSRQLVTLRTDLEVDFDLDAARWEADKVDAPTALQAFKELGFNQMQKQLGEVVDAAQAATGQGSGAGKSKQSGSRGGGSGGSGGGDFLVEDSLFAAVAAGDQDAAVAVLEERIGFEAHLVATKKDLDALIKRLKKAKRFSVDTETTSLRPREAELCGISVAIEPGEAWYVPIRSPEPESHLDRAAVVEAFRDVLEDASIAKLGHNLKYDMLVLRSHGVELGGTLIDTMVASYVVDATRSSHKLDVLALAMLDHSCIPISELIGTGKKQKRFDEVPLELAGPYAAEDAEVVLRLWEGLEAELKRLGLMELFETVEMPLVPVLAELEFNGIKVDRAELQRQRESLSKKADDLRQRIADCSPIEFNPDSPKQLAAVLFNKADDAEAPGLGLKVIKRGKTGPSTDQEVLEKLSADPDCATEVPGLILEYRQLTKLVNTYLVALEDFINPQTGRVHASFNQTVAATGRLSSSDPNLQNIPIRTEVGREIRRAFVAEDGCVLLSADYSQIELRMLAHLSQDPALIDAFHAGADIHTAVAAEVFGVEAKDVSSQQRNTAKMINFGIVYGVTPWGLARRLGGEVTVEEAGGIIDDYKRRYAGINTFLQECIEHAKSHGYVETILGRRRAIPQIAMRNPQQRALGERMAINTVVQGSAADLIKLAMMDIHANLPEKDADAKLLLQIHDELVLEVPEKRAEPLRDWVVERMEGAMDLKVPLVAEAAWSANWIDVK